MKIQITIPDNAIKDVTEYCKIHGIDLHGRMQIELDKFVANALWHMRRRRQIEREIINVR